MATRAKAKGKARAEPAAPDWGLMSRQDVLAALKISDRKLWEMQADDDEKTRFPGPDVKIGPDGIRSEGEQIAWLESAAVETVKRKQRRTIGPITIDSGAGLLKVGHSKLTPAMVVNALAQLNHVKDDGEPTSRRLTVKLTEDEYRNLAMHAAADGSDPADLARQAVILFGLMRKPPAP